MKIAVLALLVSTAGSAEFPFWDGKESIADYAKRAKLEPTLTLDLGELRLDDLGQAPVLTLLIVNQREGEVAPVHELFGPGKIVRVERFCSGPIGLVLGRNDAVGGCALVEEHFFDDASPVDRLYDRLPDGAGVEWPHPAVAAHPAGYGRIRRPSSSNRLR